MAEVPSGALADATSRRGLLVVAPLLTAVTFTMWVMVPSYWVFAVGFVLWGVKSALTSGSLEALVYEELRHLGAEDRYATLMGRAEVAGVSAAVLSGAAAVPVIVTGGYAAVGAASVMSSVLASAVAITLPENRIRVDGRRPGWSASLTEGLAETRRSAPVRSAVLLVVVVTAIWGALDEYAPLLVADWGIDEAAVAAMMVVVWAGAAAGGLLAGRVERLGTAPLAAVILCGAAMMTWGAMLDHPMGVIGLAVAFGAFQLATVVADACLQHAIEGPARATVTSAAGMSTDVLTVMVYGSYAALTEFGGHAGAFALLMLPYVLLACWLVAKT